MIYEFDQEMEFGRECEGGRERGGGQHIMYYDLKLEILKLYSEGENVINNIGLCDTVWYTYTEITSNKTLIMLF